MFSSRFATCPYVARSSQRLKNRLHLRRGVVLDRGHTLGSRLIDAIFHNGSAGLAVVVVLTGLEEARGGGHAVAQKIGIALVGARRSGRCAAVLLLLYLPLPLSILVAFLNEDHRAIFKGLIVVR